MSLSCRPEHYGDVRVLVVEDQKVLADRIAEGLRDQGMAVDIAYDGGAAMEIAAFTAYDVIVLDRDLPRVHGDAVCAHLVAGPATARILMLTAAAAVEDRVDGLNLGADDYLAKPFAFAELVARVRSLARSWWRGSGRWPGAARPGRPWRSAGISRSTWSGAGSAGPGGRSR
jgi:DNA-binding response OmpR family regulator